ncbi:hypothetical protein VDG1235_4412 [Verrucomicrobiia bacterium DG1235]|nr:hypothetical protein VDG1235_4412 [Verrucomicrobiae bacterium DG1235]
MAVPLGFCGKMAGLIWPRKGAMSQEEVEGYGGEIVSSEW